MDLPCFSRRAALPPGGVVSARTAVVVLVVGRGRHGCVRRAPCAVNPAGRTQPWRPKRRRLLLALAVLGCVVVGCRGLQPADEQTPPAPTAQRRPSSPVEQPPPPAANVPSRALTDAERPPPLPAALANDYWVRTVDSSGADGASPAARWRNVALEELAAREEAPEATLRAALASSDPAVAANAAIVLARDGEGQTVPALIAASRNPRLRLPQRQAAAAALAGLDAAGVGPALVSLLDEFGRRSGDSRAAYLPELHAELLIGVARHLDAAAAPRLAQALRSPDAAVRLAALAAWTHPAAGDVPAELVALRYDADPRVRAAALGVLAARRHPQTEACAVDALTDGSLAVRLAAVSALGTIGGETARAKLAELSQGQAELIRVAAVEALARTAAEAQWLAAAEDKSWRVRQAVARALASAGGGSQAPIRTADTAVELISEDALAVARSFVRDSSPAVQTALVASLDCWPLERAGPLLFEAIDGSAYLARKAAAEQLAARWPPAEGFSFAAPAETRAAQLTELRAAWTEEYGAARLASFVEERSRDAGSSAERSVHSSTTAAPAIEDVHPARRREALRLVAELDALPDDDPRRRDVLANLAAFGPELIPTLGWAAVHEGRALPAEVYDELLPSRDAAFAALRDLTAEELAIRRRAADDLLAIARETPLPPLAVERLATVATVEDDPLVWRSVLLAVADDSGDAALRLAAAATTHPAGDVRRRGCEHLARHGDADQVGALAVALADDDAGVVRTAAEALGRIGGVEDAAPLERLLVAPDRTLRVVAATSLARLGEESGAAALERLSYDADGDVRRLAAAAMGELRDPAFVGPLVRLMDDDVGVQRTALASLAQIAGRDVAAEGQPATSLSERIERWKTWAASETAEQ